MSGVVTGAIIGALSTGAAAIAGYVYNAVGAKFDRAERRQIAADAREHEQTIRRGDRAYEDRKDVYRRVMRWATVALQRVELTEPILTYEGMPAPPEPPGEEEWRDVHVELNVLGSSEVDDAFQTLLEKMRGFNGYAMTLRMMREQRGDTIDLLQDLQKARDDVHTAFDDLRKLIRDELANL